MADQKRITKEAASVQNDYQEAANRLRAKYPGRTIVDIKGRPFACIPEDDCHQPVQENPRRDVNTLDLLNSRHEQALGVLASVMIDLDGPQMLTTETVVANLWAVETLLTQAQQAGLTL